MSLLGSESSQTPTASSTEGNPTSTNQAPSTSWRDSLPDDLKTNPSLSNFKEVGELAKSYVHAQSMIGKKGIILPSEKAEQAEWDSFYNHLGRPAKIEEYKINAPEGADPAQTEKFKELAYKAGLLPKQAQQLLDESLKTSMESRKAMMAQAEAAQKEQIASLQKEWGEGFGKNLDLAKLAVKELGGEEFGAYLDKSELGNDVNLIKYLSKVGKLLGEDKLRGKSPSTYGKTPEEIQSDIALITSDPDYFDAVKNPIRHKSLVDQAAALYKKLS